VKQQGLNAMGLHQDHLAMQATSEAPDGAPEGVLAGEALISLGLMYSSGRTVEPDLVEAHKWFNIAAQRGYAEAAQLRAEIAREMSRADIAEAQRKARDWLSVH
jgi:uncharacterized protein